MAPELVRKLEYEGDKVDVWAYGVLLYYCLVGCFPFRGTSETDLFAKIMRGWYKFPSNLPSTATLSREAQSLIQRCLSVDATKRITAAGILEHPWMSTGLEA